MSSTSETPNPYSYHIMKLENKITALEIAIQEFLRTDEFRATTFTLIQIRDDFKQELKDLQIDANTLPFPEK